MLPFTSVMAGSVSHTSLKTHDVPVYEASVKQEAPCKQGKPVEERRPGGNSTESLKTSNTKVCSTSVLQTLLVFVRKLSVAAPPRQHRILKPTEILERIVPEECDAANCYHTV